MFEILSQLIVSALTKLFGTSADLATKEITWKRSLLVALVDLFDSLVELEAAAGKSLSLFESYAQGTKDVTRVIARDRLDEVARSLSKFAEALRRVESKLSIYDHDLLMQLYGTGMGKMRSLATVDLILEAIPSPVREGKRLTSLISYPTRLPDPSDFPTSIPIFTARNSRRRLKR